MKYLIKTIYLIPLLIIGLFFVTPTLAKDSKIKYSRENISNYFLGIISLNQNYTSSSYKYFNKIQSLKKNHSNYNIQFIRSLVLLEKFDQAFKFSKEIWSEEGQFLEVDLLLGLDSFIKKDYLKAEKHFQKLNKTSEHSLFFDDFLGNILISWIKASENKKEESFKFLNKIPERYTTLKSIQNSFLNCYFDTPKTPVAFENIIGKEESSFSRYNFFLLNYFVSKNQIESAKILASKSLNFYNSNLLIRQAKNFINNKKSEKITNFFNCKNPEDVMAEIFYVIANLFSTEKNYLLSNFYLKISLFLNDSFTPNKALLAENFFLQKKYEESKKIYKSIKSIGDVYSWFASKSIAIILLETKGKEYAISNLKKEFGMLVNPNFEHYYELANFYKDNEYYDESIKYYSYALENMSNDHFLIPKILDRRGTSYERLGKWNLAEKDLLESLEILPDQPYVLNYLAYSWIEKGVNVNRSLEMLKQATSLRKNDPYITDSLGWAYYKIENYTYAEKFLRIAVQLMPLDPVINDHYGDVLWMLNKSIQARYFWKYVLSLETTEKKLKDTINKKLILGITKKL